MCHSFVCPPGELLLKSPVISPSLVSRPRTSRITLIFIRKDTKFCSFAPPLSTSIPVVRHVLSSDSGIGSSSKQTTTNQLVKQAIPHRVDTGNYNGHKDTTLAQLLLP